ncbi:MAG: NUDIX domain-containing protein [Rubrobacter sp.]|nr:NUDIX domain-containing protein [Rubrobacter sp.]
MAAPSCSSATALYPSRYASIRTEPPGGRLEEGETPEGCLAREVLEETGLEVSVGPLLDAWIYGAIALSSRIRR